MLTWKISAHVFKQIQNKLIPIKVPISKNLLSQCLIYMTQCSFFSSSNKCSNKTSSTSTKILRISPQLIYYNSPYPVCNPTSVLNKWNIPRKIPSQSWNFPLLKVNSIHSTLPYTPNLKTHQFVHTYKISTEFMLLREKEFLNFKKVTYESKSSFFRHVHLILQLLSTQTKKCIYTLFF